MNEEITFSCRFHPTDSFHEIGCSHIEWTKEQLLEALMTKKRFEREQFEKFKIGVCPYCSSQLNQEESK